MRNSRLAIDSLSAAVLVVVGVVLRIPFLGRGFWRDEGATYFDIASRALGGVLVATRAHELTPPAYFVLAWSWAQAFGSSEIALHTLSLLWSAIAIAYAYALGNTLGGRYAGIAVALCTIFAPLSLDVGMEARPYAMILALATFTLYAFFRAQRQTSGTSRWTIAFAVGALALGLTHFTAIVFIGLLALASLAVLLVQGDGSRPVIAIAFVVAFFDAAWAHAALQDRSRIQPWSSDTQGGTLTPLDDGLNYFVPFGTMNTQVVRLFEAALLVWIIACIRRAYTRIRGAQSGPGAQPARDPVSGAIAICSVITIGGVLFTYLTHTPEERHLTIFAPAAWCAGVLLAQYVITALRALHLPWAIALRVIVVLLAAYVGIGGIAHYPQVYRALSAPISGTRAAVAAEMRSNAQALVAVPAFLGWSLGYYLDRNNGAPLLGIPSWSDPAHFVPDGAPPARLPGATALAEQIDRNGPKRIALFYDPTIATISQPQDVAGQQLYTGILRAYRITGRQDFPGRREPIQLIQLERR